MKVISMWQPYAALSVYGHKKNETRPMAPPRTLPIGTRFAVASTKQVKSEQTDAANNPRFQRCYKITGMNEWTTLPRGFIVGTVVLGEAFQITAAHVEALDECEYLFGDWRIGRFAWPMLDPILLAEPIPVRGQQGIFDYHGDIPQH